MRLPLAVALALIALTAAAGPAMAGRMRVVVPAYQYPTLGTLWSDLAVAAPRVPVVAILDPANGPGTFQDPNYVAAVNALRAAGGKVYGYVYTHYATRGADTVLADAARYDSLYAIDGFFVDELTADGGAAHLAYYAGLLAGLHALAPARPVLGNPGIDCDAGYVTTAHFDELLTFEHWDGYDTWAPLPWMLAQPPARFVNLVYARHDEAGMRDAIRQAAQRNVGGVYVTDDSLPNPWDTTPAYWAAEVAVAETTTVAAGTLAVPPGDGAGGGARVGNPAFGRAHFAWERGRYVRALVVADAAGRIVRVLRPAADASAIEWDGRDEAGRGVGAGVYFARVAGDPPRTLRFTLLR